MVAPPSKPPMIHQRHWSSSCSSIRSIYILCTVREAREETPAHLIIDMSAPDRYARALSSSPMRGRMGTAVARDASRKQPRCECTLQLQDSFKFAGSTCVWKPLNCPHGRVLLHSGLCSVLRVGVECYKLACQGRSRALSPKRICLYLPRLGRQVSDLQRPFACVHVSFYVHTFSLRA